MSAREKKVEVNATEGGKRGLRSRVWSRKKRGRWHQQRVARMCRKKVGRPQTDRLSTEKERDRWIRGWWKNENSRWKEKLIEPLRLRKQKRSRHISSSRWRLKLNFFYLQSQGPLNQDWGLVSRRANRILNSKVVHRYNSRQLTLARRKAASLTSNQHRFLESYAKSTLIRFTLRSYSLLANVGAVFLCF